MADPVEALIQSLRRRKRQNEIALQHLSRTHNRVHTESQWSRRLREEQALAAVEKEIAATTMELEQECGKYKELERKHTAMDYQFRKFRGWYDELLKLIYEQGESTQQVYQRRIRKIFELKDPKRLAELDSLLSDSAGNEHRLYRKLCREYRQKPRPAYQQITPSNPPPLMKRIVTHMDFGDYTPQLVMEPAQHPDGRASMVLAGQHRRLATGARAAMVHNLQVPASMLDLDDSDEVY